MVRCGHCMQAFDARPGFIPDAPSPQLALPIDELPADNTSIETRPDAVAIKHHAFSGIPEPEIPTPSAEVEPDVKPESVPEPFVHPAEADLPDSHAHYVEHLTIAEQTDTDHIDADEDEDEGGAEVFVRPRIWPWAAGSIIATLILFAQSVYFLRIDIAARFPPLKPALSTYCQMLNCSVPYPQKSALISIESSGLDADPAHENQITLNALLRNRASFSQAFPSLSLTLSDNQDKPLARRLFAPVEYLPANENEKAGFGANHEVSIKLPLYTGTLRPIGYQLEFFYSAATADNHPASLPRGKK